MKYHDEDFSNLASSPCLFDAQSESPPAEQATLAQLLIQHNSPSTAMNSSDTPPAPPDRDIIQHGDLFGDECLEETDGNLSAAVDAAIAEGLQEPEVTQLGDLLSESVTYLVAVWALIHP